MDLSNLPKDLPVPIDDGACSHLKGMKIPDIELLSTSDRDVNLSKLSSWVVIYFYPMTGRPNVALPDGWEQIPGARGCTPQSCSFRDHHKELKLLNAEVFGVSVQDTEYQLEAKNRLHLPFDLLSDSSYALSNALRLPTFYIEGFKLIKRTTIIAKSGIIEKVFYPVFPPDKNADQVIAWLSEQKA